MKKEIDCLLIGHNEMNFQEYEKNIREMGTQSGAYRDLNLNFINYNNKPYSASEMFNLFYTESFASEAMNKPLNITETFNAAIAYLGSYLFRRGKTFDYVNSFQEEKEELAEKLKQDNILTIAIITTLYVSALPILEIVDFIRKYNTTSKIIIGGPFVATQVRTQKSKVLEYSFKSIGADVYVYSSQGEGALVKIIDSVKNNLSLHSIHNIYYKNHQSYTATPHLEENNPLSHNMVLWNLFSHKLGQYVNVRTSISCPFSCAFCGFPQHTGKYQTAGIKAIEKELNLLNNYSSVSCVQFIDDTFNVPPKRFKKILRMMINNKYRFRWYSHFRCQFADEETVELMKESGCDGVFLGIESGNDNVLKKMNKFATVQEYMKGISLLKKYEILTYGSFIVGFPGETYQSVQDTIQFIKNSQLDFYRAQLWYCEPITPIWSKKEEYKIKGESFEWSHAFMNSKQAADLIDEIFLSIEQPAWVPQYNFECDSIFHLIHRGLSVDQIKKFLKSFNNGVREKLLNTTEKEVSFDVINQIKEVFIKNNPFEVPVTGQKKMDTYKADFDF